MWTRAVLVVAVLVVTLVAGCGAEERREAAEATVVRGYGLAVELPAGWHGEVARPSLPGALTLRAANFGLPDPPTDVGQQAQRTMGAGDILITLAHYGRAEADTDRPRRGLLAIERADFTSFEGFARPVATDSFVLGDDVFQLWVVFGAEPPSDDLLGEANSVLATVRLAPRALSLAGLRMQLPVGWDGFAKQLGPRGDNPGIYAANVPWPDRGQNLDDAALRALFERLPADGVVVSAAAGPHGVDLRPPALEPPLSLADGHFLAEAYEGQPAPQVSTQIISGRIGERALTIQVFFGQNDPNEAMRAEANAVLTTLSVGAAPAT